MPYDARKPLIEALQALRKGRSLVCLLTFDRPSHPPIGVTESQFRSDMKEPLFRVLKESLKGSKGKVDLLIYTRGGDTNAVWPIVSLVREFDTDFEVLVPFRCHSAGTLVALGAKTIHLGPLSELSPIDPSTGNQFNPPDPFNAGRRLAISVEDAQAYRDFVADLASKTLVATMLPRLVDNVHPLALGNVHRVHKQIKQLGQNLLRLHGQDAAANKKAVEKLTSEFYSHLHMVNRNEALEILGSRVQFADDALAHAMDALLHCYETQFNLRTTFSIADFMGDDDQKDVRFAAGAIESTARSYLLVTTGRIGQHSKLGAGVQVQLAPSQKMPLIKGLPREYDIEVGPHGWVHNFEPKGLTL